MNQYFTNEINVSSLFYPGHFVDREHNLQKCQKCFQVPEGKPINAQFQNLGSENFVLINVEENLKILQKSANRDLKLARPLT